MDMSGEVRIPATRETVWEALNDPDVLRQSIPGAETVEKESNTSFSATVKTKIGPVSARFKGNVEISDIDPPNGYTISGSGNGGAAGFAKGSAKVTLVEDGADTVLSYRVTARIGGKLAQVGQRLIDSTSKKMSDAFFANLSEIIAPQEKPATDPIAPTDAPLLPDEDIGAGLSPWMWGTALIAGALVMIYFFGS